MYVLSSARLFDAGVQEANIRHARHDAFAVEFQQEPQHAVRAGVLRPHVQQHRLAGKRSLGHQRPELIQRDFGNTVLCQ